MQRVLVSLQCMLFLNFVCARANKLIFTSVDAELSAVAWLHRKLVEEPLLQLYLNSPAAFQLGGWHGMSMEQICGRLTGQSEFLWSTHSIECEELVMQRFSSFTKTSQSILYFWVVYQAIRLACECASFWVRRRLFLMKVTTASNG